MSEEDLISLMASNIAAGHAAAKADYQFVVRQSVRQALEIRAAVLDEVKEQKAA